MKTNNTKKEKSREEEVLHDLSNKLCLIQMYINMGEKNPQALWDKIEKLKKNSDEACQILNERKAELLKKVA